MLSYSKKIEKEVRNRLSKTDVILTFEEWNTYILINIVGYDESEIRVDLIKLMEYGQYCFDRVITSIVDIIEHRLNQNVNTRRS